MQENTLSFGDRRRRHLQLISQSDNPRLATTLEWLRKKNLITETEFIAGNALALLLEWRLSSFSPMDSTGVFAARMNATTETITPCELPLLVRDLDDRDGRVISVEEILMQDKKTQGLNLTGAIFYESVRERLSKFMFTGDELRYLQRLFLKALPERPDLMVMLGQAVTERIGVRDLPYRDVPLLCSALYLLKEHWREQLLEAEIDQALADIESDGTRQGLAA